MKRGHTSLHGVVTAIVWPTGQVLDFEAYSKFCHTCSQQRVALGAGKLTQAEFDEQQAAHNCSVTSTGSSGGMDIQGAVDLWTRSEEKYNLRYVTFIGDGDCKGYQAVANSSPYGAECEVEKEECVGHVQKRVGTCLRDLKKRLGTKKLTDGKPIGGQGRLLDRMIDLLQNYFGKAIRNNTTDLQAMAKAAWAALMHKVAFENEEERHKFCPEGEASWCGWQRHKAGAEDQYIPSDRLPVAIFEVLKPIWRQLTDKVLLQKCLRGATQNHNEAWNGMLWGMCPKTSFVGAEVVKLSAALTCMRFNHGACMYATVIEHMGISQGLHTMRALEEMDATRVKSADRKASEGARQARKRRRRARKGLEDEIVQVEGQVYGAGIAD